MPSEAKRFADLEFLRIYIEATTRDCYRLSLLRNPDLQGMSLDEAIRHVDTAVVLGENFWEDICAAATARGMISPQDPTPTCRCCGNPACPGASRPCAFHVATGMPMFLIG